MNSLLNTDGAFRMIRTLVGLPPFPGFDPDREDNHYSETRDERAEHKNIAVVRAGSETEKLWSGCQRATSAIAIEIDSQGSS